MLLYNIMHVRSRPQQSLLVVCVHCFEKYAKGFFPASDEQGFLVGKCIGEQGYPIGVAQDTCRSSCNLLVLEASSAQSCDSALLYFRVKYGNEVFRHTWFPREHARECLRVESRAEFDIPDELSVRMDPVGNRGVERTQEVLGWGLCPEEREQCVGRHLVLRVVTLVAGDERNNAEVSRGEVCFLKDVPDVDENFQA